MKQSQVLFNQSTLSSPEHVGEHSPIMRLPQSTTNRMGDESWLVSYLDVFLLIIALLVIMLTQTPEMAAITHSTKPVVTSDIELGIEQTIANTLKSLGDDHRVSIITREGHLSVRLDESLLFDSSKAVIKAEGKDVIKQLIPTLISIDRPIVIEGHTDDTPINTLLYPSNWELSAARANSVLHYLRTHGMPQKQMSTANYADTRPLLPNDNDVNKSINRRVNLRIQL